MVFGVEQQTNPSTPNKMASEKKYIGGGKATKWNGVTVTLRMEEAERFIHETENGKFLSFIVSPRKTASPAGSTHSAFVLVGAPEPQPAMPEPAMAEEPEVIAVKGRRLRRISADKAAELRAAQAA
jgi:hypothetical protein